MLHASDIHSCDTGDDQRVLCRDVVVATCSETMMFQITWCLTPRKPFYLPVKLADVVLC